MSWLDFCWRKVRVIKYWHYSCNVSRMKFENKATPHVANDNEILTESELESKKYREYVRLREEAPAQVRAELEARLGGPLESAGILIVHETAQALFNEYAANAGEEGNGNRMKAEVAATIAEATAPFVTAFKKIEALRSKRPDIPLPRVFANDNTPEQNKVAA